MVGGVTCPECGKDNPDFLDNCQFCQAVLRKESTLNIGENPTKKVTGDLEPILPDWLREARQQGRDLAEADARKEATEPRVQKEEPLDLLAGLAFEAASDEDEVPDWLAAINPVEKKTPEPSKEEEPSDFFAQFNAPVKESPPPATPKDELTSWMPQAGAQPEESLRFDSGATQDDNAWLNNLGAPVSQEPAAWNEPEKPAEPEDLSWLHELESSTKQQPAAPQADTDWMANLGAASTASAGSQDDLSWLNNLGGTPMPSFDAPAQPASSQDDLSWLNNLGGTPAPSFDTPAPAQPASSQEDLDWLNNLGGIPAPSFNTPAPAQPTSSPEDLDWLNNLGGAPASAPSFDRPAPAQPASSTENLDWLNNLGGTPAPAFDAPASAQPASSQEDLDWLNNLGGTPATSTPSFDAPAPSQPASSQEDLDWLNNLGGTSAPASSFDTPVSAQPASSQEDLDWLNNLGGTPAPAFDTPAPAQPASSQEDLDWLNNLGGTSAPAASFDATVHAQPVSSSEDLDWLNNLGGTPASASSFDTPAPTQPASSQEDLDWLNNLGGTSAPAASFDTPAPTQPVSSPEDLDWLNTLGGTPAPASSFDIPAPSQPASSQEDLDWLNNLGGTPAPAFDAPTPAQPATSTEDLDWLNNLGAAPTTTANAPSPFAKTDQLKGFENPPDTPISPFTPRRTAPLNDDASQEATMPDWLKSATEGASMPPLGATSMDWLTSKDEPVDESPLRFDEDAQPTTDQPQGLPASVDQNIFATPSDSSSLSNQDIDSLFAVDMPDWLSQAEPASGDATIQPGASSSSATDALAPVNLPSWVQAMRPVESVISDVSAASVDQNTEQEGPLAGLRGVIPFAPIGSALRPKSISLKLQATEEQQASAALLEQILASETTAHPLKAAPFVASQRILRWALSAIFILVLGVMIGMGTTQMPVSAALPIAVSDASNVVATMPDNAPVLIVIDYEPALSGEMEAVAGPLLDQMTGLRHPLLSFVSTSPNGSALVERLMTNTKLNQPAPDGQGYQADQYINLGYLPGGSAGVRGFTEQPKLMLPSVTVAQFSDYAAVIVITDHAESGLVWIEQLQLMKQTNPALADQPLLILASAQAGPLLQPYVSSKQVAGMVYGLSDAARYEFVNNSRPGIARSYWDAFGVGLFMAILAIVLGSLWGLFIGMRARRAEAEQG